jgi:hypothetical protein
MRNALARMSTSCRFHDVRTPIAITSIAITLIAIKSHGAVDRSSAVAIKSQGLSWTLDRCKVTAVANSSHRGVFRVNCQLPARQCAEKRRRIIVRHHPSHFFQRVRKTSVFVRNEMGSSAMTSIVFVHLLTQSA